MVLTVTVACGLLIGTAGHGMGHKFRELTCNLLSGSRSKIRSYRDHSEPESMEVSVVDADDH